MLLPTRRIQLNDKTTMTCHNSCPSNFIGLERAELCPGVLEVQSKEGDFMTLERFVCRAAVAKQLQLNPDYHFRDGEFVINLVDKPVDPPRPQLRLVKNVIGL